MNGSFLIVILVMVVLMYFLLIRPQRAQQRKHQQMLSSVRPGDEVVTIGGIYGDVVEVLDDKLVIEIAEGVQIEVARKAVGSVVRQEDLVDEPEDEELEEDEPDVEASADAEQDAPDVEAPDVEAPADAEQGAQERPEVEKTR